MAKAHPNLETRFVLAVFHGRWAQAASLLKSCALGVWANPSVHAAMVRKPGLEGLEWCARHGFSWDQLLPSQKHWQLVKAVEHQNPVAVDHLIAHEVSWVDDYDLKPMARALARSDNMSFIRQALAGGFPLGATSEVIEIALSSGHATPQRLATWQSLGLDVLPTTTLPDGRDRSALSVLYEARDSYSSEVFWGCWDQLVVMGQSPKHRGTVATWVFKSIQDLAMETTHGAYRQAASRHEAIQTLPSSSSRFRLRG